MKKNIIAYLIIAVFVLPFVFQLFDSPTVSAGSSLWQQQEGLGKGGGPNQVAEAYGGGVPNDPRIIVANLIKIALGFVGLILLIIIMVAGFRWMTSGGNQDVISKSKSQIVSAVIGLIIIVASYALASFITSCVYGITDDSWMC